VPYQRANLAHNISGCLDYAVRPIPVLARRTVATRAEARAAVDDYVKIKPTFIKIWGRRPHRLGKPRVQSSPKFANTSLFSGGVTLTARKISFANRNPMPFSPTDCCSACSEVRTAAKPYSRICLS
jgi:hypothetical protein